MILTLNINDVDQRGNGIVSLKDTKIIVYGASLGSKVKVKISRVVGDTAYAEIIETLSEADETY